MRIKTTIITEKRVAIISPGWDVSGQGYFFTIPTVKYFDEVWDGTKEQGQKLLEEARKIYEEKYRGNWTQEPKISYYDKELEKIIEEI